MNTRYAMALVLTVSILMLTGCKSDDEEVPTVNVTKTSTEILYPTVDQKMTISFTASADWTASCSANWLRVSPALGKAGSHTITVTTTQTNRTKATRSAQIIISAGPTQKSISVRQSGEYGLFDQDAYEVGAEGGKVSITFTSNVDNVENLTLAYNSQVKWIHWDDAASTRSGEELQYKVNDLIVDPNESPTPRSAIYVLALLTSDGNWVGLDTTYVQQAGISSGYESSDYSADGTVTMMQKATKGSGIKIVMMGDGFADKDINDGTYKKVMEKSMEYLFSEEPAKSLRDYFSVYAVTAVSKNDQVGEGYSTVFSAVPDPQSSNIAADEKVVEKYTKKVNDVPDLTNVLSIVILNSHVHNGVTYLYTNNNTMSPIQYAIALCPVINDLENEEFRTVLVHEAIGHGLAKLGDEYGYKENGAATQEVYNRIANLHQYGWVRNVDSTNNLTKVDWHQFLGDDRYNNENIGAYEGGYTYTLGIYKPTQKSMMNGNDSPFNAPSRKAIYDRVMKLGEGKSESAYEEFVAFDQQHQPEQWSYSLSRSTRSGAVKRLAPPVMIYREW